MEKTKIQEIGEIVVNGDGPGLIYNCRCGDDRLYRDAFDLTLAIQRKSRTGEDRENYCNYCDVDVTDRLKLAAIAAYGEDISEIMGPIRFLE